MVSTQVLVRWMIRRDMPQVVQIEQNSFRCCWTEEDFRRCLGMRNCMGMVADLEDRILGYIVFERLRRQIKLLNLAVDPDWRRQGIGTAIIDAVKCKMRPARKRTLGAEVRETNLIAQFFFRSQGFRATAVERGFYDDTDEDAYRFIYQVEE